MLIDLDRQGETESASFPFAAAFRPDAPMVRFHQSLSDRQAYPASSAGARPGFIRAVKAVEYQG